MARYMPSQSNVSDLQQATGRGVYDAAHVDFSVATFCIIVECHVDLDLHDGHFFQPYHTKVVCNKFGKPLSKKVQKVPTTAPTDRKSTKCKHMPVVKYHIVLYSVM